MDQTARHTTSESVIEDWSLTDISKWLIVDGWQLTDTSTLVDAVAERLAAAGVPLHRMGVFFIALHPELLGDSYIWRGPGQGVDRQGVPHGFEKTDDFRLSPLIEIFNGSSDVVRRRIDEVPEDHPYPFYRMVRKQGVTDYLCLPIRFSDGQRHAISFSTKADDGFSSEQLHEMQSMVTVLERILETHTMRQIAHVLLRTYVGTQAGTRILDGQITRGSSESIRAVIWLSDLRGFTPMSDLLPREVLIDSLNTYFDCVVQPIQSSGGEVLKFIGDAVLGIWRIDDYREAPNIAHRALAAAGDALLRLEQANATFASGARPQLKFGAALHAGDVMYGNIGTSSRLDFTVIGPAVNLVSRVEQMTKVLGHPILASSTFANLCPTPLVSLGYHQLAGISVPQEIFRVSFPTSRAGTNRG